MSNIYALLLKSLRFKEIWKEIVFKIRLTEAEYKLLMKEKSNMHNINK